MPRRLTYPAAKRVRKNMDMDADKLARAQEILGARSETETVDQALDYVVLNGEVFDALDRLAAEGGISDAYAAEKAHATRVAEPGRGR